MADLTTSWLGLPLRNPLVVSASPLSRKVESVRRLEDSGASAVVVYSLFEEQIVHESSEMDHFLHRGQGMHPEALGYFPDLGNYNLEPEQYLSLIAELKSAVKIPVIGSLNGCSRGGWFEWAKKIQDAGADALELNLYSLATDPLLNAADAETELIAIIQEALTGINIPVAVKLSPFYTSLPNLVAKIAKTGVRGVVLFNRFLQPDIDPENLTVVPGLQLSTPDEIRLALRWTAILHGRVETEIGLSSGVHSGRDMVKSIMAGAQVTMVASELLAKGPQRAEEMLNELRSWMNEHEYTSVAQMRGSMSQTKVLDPGAFERANYMKALTSLNDRFL